VAVTAVWGWTFVLVKDVLSQYPPVPFLAFRFAGALALMAVLVRRLPDLRTIRVGAIAGAVLALGYLLQTYGLAYTTPGNAGMITGLYVVFTPLLERVFGVRVAPFTLLAVAVALLGTVLLTDGGGARMGAGDLLVLGCAVAFALHLVLLSRWSPGMASGPLAMMQMAAAALLFGAAGLPALRTPSAAVWAVIAVTGLFASAVGFFVQTWAQAKLSASRTALVLATEPAWALLFSVLLAGQRLVPLQALGAALVLAAIVGHEVAPLTWTSHRGPR
jgi:drug/metabolite transporter (DMT)-like permease